MTIQYNIFNGNKTIEGTITVPANFTTEEITREIEEQESVNLRGLVADRNENKLVYRAEAIFG